MAVRMLLALAVLLGLAVPLGAVVSDEMKNRPVTKVVNLMKDMLKQMEKEGEEDEDIYDKMQCWCVTNEKEKTVAIADAASRITTLQATIETTTADSARLNAETAQLSKELGENTKALSEAEALRAKQLAEFTAEEKETLQSVEGLRGAVQVLSKVNEGSFLQLTASAADQMSIDINYKLQEIYRKHAGWFHESATRTQRDQFASFIQNMGNGQSLAQAQASAPSGAIFGILKQMKEDMETSLANSAAEEKTNVADYEALKAAKTAEVGDGKALVDTKMAEAATADEKKATAKVDLEDTTVAMDADNKFLADLKVRCVNLDAEFEERTKGRQLEMQAVGKALEFLTSDEAHDLFSRTFNPAFLQRSKTSQRRVALSKMLAAVGAKAKDPRISSLAVQARINDFAEVKKTISDMIDKLKKEAEDDVKHKDFCIDEFNANEKDTTAKTKEKEKIQVAIEDFGMTIEELTKAIETLKTEVVELEKQQVTASEEREKANKEFQATVSDQRATQKLLAVALKVLSDFYGKAALIQEGAKAAQPPPPGFKPAEKSAASGGVMGMMQKIINEAKALEVEAQHAEEKAQEDFEEFTKDTTQTIADKNKDIVHKSEDLAQAEKDRIQKEVERDATLTNLEELAQGNADLHNSCDFLLKNFDVRSQARSAEQEALEQGMALFSGASFGAFLQQE